MTGKDAIRTALTSTKDLMGMYLSDLSDADLLVRPAPTANHIAWQLGHLISAEVMLNEQLPGAAYPTLSPAFIEQHKPTTAALDPPKGFSGKGDYLALFAQVREGTIKGLGSLSDADLDRPTKGPMAKWAPTLGALLLLTSNHILMHLGQVTVVRRKLGKPILF